MTSFLQKCAALILSAFILAILPVKNLPDVSYEKISLVKNYLQILENIVLKRSDSAQASHYYKILKANSPRFKINRLREQNDNLVSKMGIGQRPVQNTHSSAAPAEISDFSRISPTVKIVSWDFTWNGEIFPYAQGSGTILTPDGLILTNNHVIAGEDEKPLAAFEICLTQDQNRAPVCEYTADLVARNPDIDLAILKMHPQDIYGQQIASLAHLDYTIETEPKVEEQVKIIGFPDIGGETITITRGVISGFTEENQNNSVVYIETDSDISSGNSGGTMVNAEGIFIGVPTLISYSLSTSENLGLAIDLRSVRPWITENLRLEAQPGDHNELLASKKRLIKDANTSHNLSFPYYPQFEITADQTWFFEQIEKTGLVLFSEQNDRIDQISIDIEQYPFLINNSEYYHQILQEIEDHSHRFTGYKREKIPFAGAPAELISFITYNNKNFIYLIPYGKALVQVSYSIDLKQADNSMAKILPILQTFRWIDSMQNPEPPSEIHHELLDFSIKTSGTFLMQKTEDYRSKYSLLNFLQPDNLQGRIGLWYFPLEDFEKELTLEELLQDELDSTGWLDDFTLIEKKSDFVLDGLPGWSLTYSYRGFDYLDTHIATEIFIPIGDNYFYFEYDDEEKSYEENVESFRAILNSMVIGRQQPDKGKYTIGNLTYAFQDIKNHRFVSAISRMKDRGIVNGFDGQHFGPEMTLTRAEALKMIVESKLYDRDEEKDQRYLINDYRDIKYAKLNFGDHENSDWFTKYVRYARENNILRGFPDGGFHPHSEISVAEALAMLFKTHEVKIWQGIDETSAEKWHKPYMDKAFQMGVLPADMSDPHRLLTRAEFAYIVDSLLTSLDK